MPGGYFRDGTINIELGAYCYATPRALRSSILLEPHGRTGVLLDTGGGVQEMEVTAQRLRENLGDAERWLYEHLHSLAAGDPGELGCEDNAGNRAVFGGAVCTGGVGQVSAARFCTLRLDFAAPETEDEPAWAGAPSDPATAPGTATDRDYAAGGVGLGHHPLSMRVEMTREFPVRLIPRARGTRARGPARGAVLRFTVTGCAEVTDANLADYLRDLARSIGSGPVHLTANGNTYEDVLLRSLRPAHTDRRHTTFEAEFIREV